MRREPSLLKDILSSCRKIVAIVRATNEDSFLKDEILPAAVLHHLTVIGEAIRPYSGFVWTAPSNVSRQACVAAVQCLAANSASLTAYVTGLGGPQKQRKCSKPPRRAGRGWTISPESNKIGSLESK